MSDSLLPALLRLRPKHVPKIWGGNRLLPQANEPIGESWIVSGDSVVDGGPLNGLMLDELPQRQMQALLGSAGDAALSFPLLIKLLEATEWLSVQVHPDDELAVLLEGTRVRGKTEAWYVIDAQPEAELIVGLRDDVTVDDLAADANTGRILDHLARTPVQPGDTFFMPAGTVHAIGPGVLIYEVQQMSDITYRLYDWERPASAGRELHIEQSLQMLRSAFGAGGTLPQNRAIGVERVACDYFALEELRLSESSIARDTAGVSFHALTVVGGEALVEAGAESVVLEPMETVLLPAATGRYVVSGSTPATLLVARLPDNGR